MNEYPKTGTEYVAQEHYLKRREIIKLQIEREVMRMVREIVNEKLAQLEPVIDELEALDKLQFKPNPKGA